MPPYKPQDDLEQAPLLCSATNMPSEHMPLHASDHISISGPLGPAGGAPMMPGPQEPRPRTGSTKLRWQPEPLPTTLPNDHEYHEISDEENLVAESPRFEVS